MKTKFFIALALTFAVTRFCFAQTASPATAKAGNVPYIEGPVWTLTMVKTKTGMDDDYLRQITGTVKPIYDDEKKQKIILDYKILMGDPHNRDEANIIIMVQYPNFAALDGLRDKMDPLIEKVMGNEDQQRATAVKRLDIREILATRTMREITLK
ncbi:MAG: hypothetical protein ABJB69_03400 [Spartobacteria bacterium]